MKIMHRLWKSRSLAYSAEVDIKVVSQILGYASTSVTFDAYTHLTEEKAAGISEKTNTWSGRKQNGYMV